MHLYLCTSCCALICERQALVRFDRGVRASVEKIHRYMIRARESAPLLRRLHGDSTYTFVLHVGSRQHSDSCVNYIQPAGRCSSRRSLYFSEYSRSVVQSISQRGSRTAPSQQHLRLSLCHSMASSPDPNSPSSNASGSDPYAQVVNDGQATVNHISLSLLFLHFFGPPSLQPYFAFARIFALASASPSACRVWFLRMLHALVESGNVGILL